MNGFLILIGILSSNIVLLLIAGAYLQTNATRGVMRITRKELTKYNGENGNPIFLAIKGKVFDVSKAEEYYGVGGSYSGFAGRDASRAFHDLCFTEECLKVAHDLSGLDEKTKKSIDKWFDFYDKPDPKTGEKKYEHVGWVVEEEENKEL